MHRDTGATPMRGPNEYDMQAWKKCISRDLGSDKTADFGIKFGENAILVRVSRIKFTFWGINRMG